MQFKYPPSLRSIFTMLTVSALAASLSACGGSSSAPVAVDNQESDSDITGSVVAAPVAGANCVLKDASGVDKSDPFTTDASGNYSIEIHAEELENDVQLVCAGGTYTDEADGSTQNAGTLSAFLAGGTLGHDGGSIHATPGSTIINRLRAAGMTPANARTAFENAFGFVPDASIAPTDATAPATDATEAQKLAGLRAAIFSQLTADLGLNPGQQFDLLDALVKDLSDGNMDGADSSGAVAISGTANDLPADIQNRFGNALVNFRAGGKDKTNLTPNKIGALAFGKVAMTTNYKVEFLPGATPARMGKDEFQVRVSNRADGQPVSAAMTMMPMMYMADRTHSSPAVGCTESATAGTYDCTVYYLMASRMMTGDFMGYWEIKLMINGEAALFYPPVMMAMGDTVRADLQNSGDQIMSMTTNAMANRRYMLFKSDLTGMTGNHSFKIFLASQNTMMSFPAIYPGVTLTNGNLLINTVGVRMSTDKTNWVNAVSGNDGYYTASALAGLTDGAQGTIYVELTINGNQYTTNGNATDGSNDYAEFTVTPGGMNMSM